nr:MAG TPA: hypothetical protein [Caudoviricetes sp.]
MQQYINNSYENNTFVFSYVLLRSQRQRLCMHWPTRTSLPQIRIMQRLAQL